MGTHQTEQALLDSIEFVPGRTQRQYARQVKHALSASGLPVFHAVMDYAGNCVYCGEAGRCPGWHIHDGRLGGGRHTHRWTVWEDGTGQHESCVVCGEKK